MTIKIGENNLDFKHFVVYKGVWTPSSDNPRKEAILSPGVYNCIKDRYSDAVYFKEMQTMSDSLVDLPNTASDRICKDISSFWTPEVRSNYAKRGTVYKRGYLMYGPPGTGKTCTVANIMQTVVKAGGVVFFNPNPDALYLGSQAARHLSPDLKILVVYEEFERRAQDSDFLSILDGELQVDNIVFLATTNHIGSIPDKIKNRPGRFAHRIELGMPDKKTRTMFIKAKLLPGDNVDVDKWVKLTEGMSIDHIKDLIVSVFCIGLTLEVAVQKLKNMAADASTDDDSEDEDDYDQMDALECADKEALFTILNKK